MAIEKAPAVAKTRSAQVGKRATQRRAVVARTTGTSFGEGQGGAPARNTPARGQGAPSRGSSKAPARQARGRGRGSSFAAGAAVGDAYKTYSPTRAGEKGSAVGALEAEFLGALALLLLTLLTDTASYSDKMLAIMKRGTLVCITFFILALTAGMGPNAARFAKAFGALIDVGILLSVGSSTMIQEIDAFFKADWASVGTGGSNSNQAQAGGGGKSSGSSNAPSNPNPLSASSIAGDVKKALGDILGGINPALGKLFGGS